MGYDIIRERIRRWKRNWISETRCIFHETFRKLIPRRSENSKTETSMNMQRVSRESSQRAGISEIWDFEDLEKHRAFERFAVRVRLAREGRTRGIVRIPVGVERIKSPRILGDPGDFRIPRDHGYTDSDSRFISGIFAFSRTRDDRYSVVRVINVPISDFTVSGRPAVCFFDESSINSYISSLSSLLMPGSTSVESHIVCGVD